jgi:hypothetical protein
MRVLVACLLALYIVTSIAIPRLAFAADAASLKKEADAYMDAERFAEAAQTYARAYELSHDPALLYNEGRALEALGEYADAVARLQAFRSSASPTLLARAAKLDQHIEELKGRLATLVVTTNVSGARLNVRDKFLRTVEGSAEILVRAGPATIEVTAEGYEPFRKEVDLRAKQTTKIDVELKSRKEIAKLAVRSHPPGADVSVDGVGFGRTPLEAEIAAGTHRVTLTRAGYEAEKIDINAKNGERRELDVTMKDRSGIASRWWFWTGLGVVLAGATVATILVVGSSSGAEAKPALTGDFSPGQIPAAIRW